MKKVLNGSVVITLMLAMLIAGCTTNSPPPPSTPAPGGSPSPSPSPTSDNKPEDGGGDTIKIGVIQPFSGPTSQGGIETFSGNELAVEEINQNGGLLGKKVELIKADASNAQQGISGAERLITQEKVDLITGTYLSGVSYPATQIANKHNVLYWETNALAPNITQQGFKNVIRIGLNNDTIVEFSIDSVEKVVAPALGKSVKDLKIVIIHEQSIYGTSIGEKEEQILKDMGAQVMKRLPYDPASADLSSVVNLAKNENPDVLLRIGYVNDGVLLLKHMRDLGWKPPVFIGVADDSSYFPEALGKEGMEGMLSISYPAFDMSEKYGPGLQKFLERYKSKYGKDPIMPQTLASYASTKILFELIEETGSTDADAIREAALKMDVPIGGTYATGFGVKLNPETLDNTRAYPVLTQWQNGAPRTIYPYEAVGKDAKIQLPLKPW